MSGEFSYPDWLPHAPELPPLPVDGDRIEGLVNGYIAAAHDALHTAPDAFYRLTGQEAVDGVPAIAARLSRLRDATLDRAADDGERAALSHRLEPNITVLADGIDRHAAQQKQVRNRQIIAERQALNTSTAALHHADDGMLSALANANAQAARALAGLTGEPEEAAMQAARSAIWRTAIDESLANGKAVRALDLFSRIRKELAPADQRALEVPIQSARAEAAADAWIARETDKEGEPLTTRLQADQTMSQAEKATALAKIEARDSAKESARIATVRGLDDKLGTANRSLATQPVAYKRGTLAAVADGYDDAGESEKANAVRRLALQEGFLLSFARSGAAAQQRLINSLPEGEDRVTVEAIQRQQAEAFARDAFAAGTALYPDVGPPAPISDLADRIAQARTITAYRGIPVAPFTAHEMATLRRKLADGTPQERDALFAQLDALPEDMKAAIASTQRLSANVERATSDGQIRDASLTQKPNAPVKVFPDMPDPTVPIPPNPPEPEPEPEPEPGQQRPFHRPLRITPPRHPAPAPNFGNEIV